jgi:hypothetical protein
MKKYNVGIAVGLSVTLSALLSINIASADNQFRMAFSSSNEGIEIVDDPLFFSDISSSKQAEYDNKWLTFLRDQTGIEIPSIDSLNYNATALPLGAKNFNDTALPSGPLNIQTPAALNLGDNNLTHLNFLRTTTVFRDNAQFNDNALKDVNGLLNLDEALGGLYLNRNKLQQVLGLEKLTSVSKVFDLSENTELSTLDGMGNLDYVGNALNLSKNPALVDLTGISDLRSVGNFIYLDDVSQYTSTPTSESIFCTSIVSGDINIKDRENNTINFGELCSGVESWIAFFHSHDQLTHMSHLSEWSTKYGSASVVSKDLVDADMPSEPMLTNYIATLKLYQNNITHVDFLSNVEIITSDLDLSNLPNLENINGLSALTSVKNLSLSSNPSLTNIDSLSSLPSLNEIYLNNNLTLSNVDGLSSLQSVGDLRLYKVPLLSNVDGLSSLESGVDINIHTNDLLNNVDGLSSLQSVENLNLHNNPSLTNLNGLSSLQSIDDLRAFNNPSLTNVDGLSSIRSIIDLYLQDNPSLTNVDGLSALTYVNNLSLKDNPELTNISGLLSLVSAGLNIVLDNNPKLIDISGLSNLARFTSNRSVHGVTIDNPSQYTVRPAIGTPFCEGLKSGAIRVKKRDRTQINYSELCY